MPELQSSLPEMEPLAGAFSAGCATIENEGVCLDEQRWDCWLSLYAEDVRYWVPTWRSNGILTTDPEIELSHIFYDSRKALEDRVSRFSSRESPASNPIPRTTHIFSAFQLVDGSTEESLHIRSSWVTHIYFPQKKGIHQIFGFQRYTIVRKAARWVIAAKTVQIQNDYIPTMLDVYCL
jgi:3-phenylpropionate/cinnamic acid dioxygenase small subunit